MIYYILIGVLFIFHFENEALKVQGQEFEGIICLQTGKQFLAFHFLIERNNNMFSKDSCL